ncbi:MAG TPA: proline/glycine betaine ABC transporter ATP-binding protein, partial [Lactobacillus acetotolerans]|nr:proline/glycine betaine ABC transporter ATP-binding protein [Lactobacillus acetotolerans]
MKSKLQFKHIYVTYNKVDAVHDLNLEINSGELFVLVGASGCGKTTTLKMVNRLQTPTKG